MELKPWEFWSLMPCEFNALASAYYRRLRRERETAAAWVCTIVNHMPMRGKNAKTLKVEQLIGYSEEQKKELLALQRKARAGRKTP